MMRFVCEAPPSTWYSISSMPEPGGASVPLSTMVRVFSGTLRPDTELHVSGHGRASAGHPDHDVTERVGAISRTSVSSRRAAGQIPLA